MDPNSETFNYIATGIPLDATVLFSRNTLEYEGGKIADQASGVYNHHVAFINTSKLTPLFSSCPAGSATPFPSMPSVIMGASEEIGASSYSTPDGKFNSGYYIGKLDKIVIVRVYMMLKVYTLKFLILSLFLSNVTNCQELVLS
jgi:hypothetical protein